MRKMPLSLQIWALCTGVTLCIFGLIMLFMPNMLNGFFTREVYDLLEESQKSVQMITLTVSDAQNPGSAATPSSKTGKANMNSKSSMNPESITVTQAAAGEEVQSVAFSDGQTRPLIDDGPISMAYSGIAEVNHSGTIKISTTATQGYVTAVIPALQILPSSPAGNSSGLPPVNHLFIGAGVKSELAMDIPKAFFKIIQEQAKEQQQTIQRYSHDEGNRSLLYVIRKQNILGKPGYLVTYAWGSYTRELSSNLMKQLLWLMIALCLISGIPSFFLARYLTRPLVEMEKAARRISEHNWQEPLISERRDEIGRLARSFDKMRIQLAQQDEAQQSFLQNLSHELKTPAMVISSYAQAILDGIYPRGSLEESVKVIKEESTRLQKRVQDFLYLNKLKYMALHRTENESFALDSLIEDTVERLRWQRPDLEWELNLTEWQLKGDRQQWAVALENLLDNQMRYAQNRVEVSLMSKTPDEAQQQLRVFNDGPQIETDLLEHIFAPYASGHKGQFGLGLTIFKQVMEIHGTRFWACNEAEGVAFYIEPQI